MNNFLQHTTVTTKEIQHIDSSILKAHISSILKASHKLEGKKAKCL